MEQNKNKISEAELEIMRIIWNGAETYAQIRKEAEDSIGWDSSTIRTLIRRLVKKGALQQEKREVYYYTAVLAEADYVAEKTRVFVDKVYEGNAKDLVAALLDQNALSREDMEELTQFWARASE